MMIAFGLAHLLKLNKFVTIAASNISIPPLMPLILFLSYLAGGLVAGANVSYIHYSTGITLHWIKANLIQYLIGSVVFGLFLAIAGGFISYILLSKFRKKRPGIIK